MVAVALLAAVVPVMPAGAAASHGWTMAWGENSSGQLGRPGAGSGTPVDVAPPNGLPGVTRLTGGAAHSLALTQAGQVYAWGRNFYGQLGRQNFGLGTDSSTPLPVNVPIAVAVAAGDEHSLALTVAGDVYAWGSNTTAQLSLDPRTVGLSPAPVKVEGLPKITAIAAGAGHSLALATDGTVWAWGDNAQGQLGTGGITGDAGAAGAAPIGIRPAPVGLGSVSAIAAGARHSLAVVGTGGAVYAWGDNDSGQLNDPGTNGLSNPLPVATGVSTATAVAAGGRHSAALLGNKTVSAWGSNASGQLGRPLTTASGPPAAIAGLGGVSLITARGEHNLAVQRTATAAIVHTWGDNSAGQLGRSTSLPSDPTPKQAGTFDTAVAIGAGTSHSLAAAAPRAVLDRAVLTFPGIIEVGSRTPALDARLSNRGPGPLVVTAARFQEGEQDFEFAPGGDTCSGATLASGASCTLSVVFAPKTAGRRDSFIVIDQDGFDGPLNLALHGDASVVAGAISISTAQANLTDGVPASPSAVPLNDIPLQPGSPMIADAQAAGDLPAGDLTGIGDLPLGDLTRIGDLPLGDLTRIGNLPAGDLTGIGDLPLGDLTRIGDLPLGDLTRIAPVAQALLQQVTLASLPLTGGYAWDGDDPANVKFVVSGSPALHGQPLQQLTLGQVVADATAAARFRAVPVRNVGWAAGSPLGGIGLLATLLGSVPLAAISGDWCAQLEAAGLSGCGNGYGRPGRESDGLSSSAMEYQMAGLAFTALRLSTLRLGDVHGTAPFHGLILGAVDLYRSDLGSVALAAIPDASRNAVVDCGQVDCATDNLYEASRAGALREGAVLGDLGNAVATFTLGELALGLLPVGDDPYGANSLEDLGTTLYGGGDGVDSHRFDYTISFTNTGENALPDGTTISTTLPDSFVFVPGSSKLTVDGEAAAIGFPTRSGSTITWPLTTGVPAGSQLRLTFSARPGLLLGTFTVSSVRLDGARTSVVNTTPSAPVRVVEDREPNDTPATAVAVTPSIPALGEGPGTTGELRIGHIAGATDRDFYRFRASEVPAGSLITVHLDHQTEGDADLLLYGAPGMTGEAPLRAPKSNGGLTPITEQKLGLANQSASLAGERQSDLHVQLGLPLLGVSQNRGTAGEAITAVALRPGTSGDVYTIEVGGYNGAPSDRPYSLRVTVTPKPELPAAPPRSFPNPPDPTSTLGLPAASSFDGAKTLFLTAPGRLQRLYGKVAADSVTAALADPRLGTIIGKYGVLQVDAGDGSGSPTAVQRAFSAWDASPADPVLANDVVRSINALVDQLVTTSGLENMVIIGGDEVIPMGRVPDLTTTVSELGFLQELASLTSANNALMGATADRRILTDDGYADFSPQPLTGGQHLYLPDVGLGRLVETPAQVVAALNQFMVYSGVVDPKTALATSASRFLDDLAHQLQQALVSQGLATKSLIDSAWGRGELRSAFTHASPPPGVVGFNGHSDATRTDTRTAATAADLFTTADVLGGNDLARSLLFTVGCHAGLPVADAMVRVPGTTEWSQAAMAKGAGAFAGNTGYGLGSRSTVALSEKLMLDFARRLPTVPLGQALAMAKQGYLAGTAAFDVLDAKALMIATYYGMPHLRYATAQPAPPAPAPPAVTTDPVTGLSTAAVNVQSTNSAAPGYYALERHDTEDGSYWSANGRTQITHNRPVQPLLDLDVTRSGSRARGVVIIGGTSTEIPGFNPVLPRMVATASPSPEDELQSGDLTFPNAIQAVRSTSGVGGVRDHALLIPALFQSSGTVNGQVVGDELLFTSLNTQVTYAPAGNTDSTPPVILRAEGIVVDGVATFGVDAVDAAPGTVKDVIVTFRAEGSSQWRSLHLLRSPLQPNHWTGGVPVAAGRVQFFSQAIDSGGLVGVMANKGRLLLARPVAERTGLLEPVVSGDGAPANPDDDPVGWLTRATVAFTGPNLSTTSITARVDGGSPQPVTGPIAFAGDGVTDVIPGTVVGDGYHTVAYQGSDGSAGTVLVRIDNQGPKITVLSPKADGTSSFALNQPATARYSCVDAASGVVECTAAVGSTAVADGGSLPTSTPGRHVLSVTTRDVAGNVRTLGVPYQVGYVFEGFLSPVRNRPFLNAWNAGQSVPMKWRLRDFAGQAITDPSTVESTGSFPIACATPPLPDGTTGEPTTSKSGLTFSGDHFEYTWATQRGLPPVGWEGTCRRFVLVLDDGTAHVADFSFS